MCVGCVRNQVDITEGIPKEVILLWCKGCGRYLSPPSAWMYAELESRELLALCLKRLKGLNKVRLADASFVWTEPHSRRVKLKVTIEKEVLKNTILRESFQVTYVVQTQFCDDCRRVEAKDTWTAVVQARQKVEHKRTFFYLEQLIIKYSAHSQIINVKEFPDGLDFFFHNRSHAVKFVDFLQSVVPVRYKASQKLISHDEQNSSYNYKYTFCVEIVPVCKNDLVFLPRKVAHSLGTIS
jgi:60S ribosomal export protein NMD3